MANICQIGAGMIGQAMAIDLAESHNVSLGDINVSSIKDKIKKFLNTDNVVLFMKGTPDFPQCGFSANAVAILNYFNVNFKSYNVLENDELRQGIKQFSDWPTIPQIYINQEFIGGFDILKDMAESGDFEEILKEKKINFKVQN